MDRYEIIDSVVGAALVGSAVVASYLSVGYATKPPQLICAVNESSYLMEGWQQLQEADRHAFAATRDVTVKAVPNAVVCTWNGFDLPTTGALWYWKPKTKEKSNG